MKKLVLVFSGFVLALVGNLGVGPDTGVALISASHAQVADDRRAERRRCRRQSEPRSRRCRRLLRNNSNTRPDPEPSPNPNPRPNPDAHCTTVTGFSQTSQSLQGLFRVYPNLNAQGIVKGNASVDVWGDRNIWTSVSVNLHPVCDKFSTDRLIMHISGEQQSLGQWESGIERAIDSAASRFSFLRQIDLMAVVGGPGGQLCQADPSKKSFGPWNRASENHPVILQAIRNVVARKNVQGVRLVAGQPVRVDRCNDFSDNKGHISNRSIQDRVGAKIYDLYFR